MWQQNPPPAVGTQTELQSGATNDRSGNATQAELNVVVMHGNTIAGGLTTELNTAASALCADDLTAEQSTALAQVKNPLCTHS